MLFPPPPLSRMRLERVDFEGFIEPESPRIRVPKVLNRHMVVHKYRKMQNTDWFEGERAQV